jgi:hypothetical protein
MYVLQKEFWKGSQNEACRHFKGPDAQLNLGGEGVAPAQSLAVCGIAGVQPHESWGLWIKTKQKELPCLPAFLLIRAVECCQVDGKEKSCLGGGSQRPGGWKPEAGASPFSACFSIV